MDGHVQERQPARQLGGLSPQPTSLILGKRLLLQLDGAPMLTPELQRLSQAGENLGALAELGGLLEE